MATKLRALKVENDRLRREIERLTRYCYSTVGDQFKVFLGVAHRPTFGVATTEAEAAKMLRRNAGLV